VIVVAPAKATLVLRVLGRRTDGYHDLDALTLALTDPHDVLELVDDAGGGLSLTVSGPAAAGVPAGPANLAWQAAELCGGRVRIALTKRIPAEAGLGGGSSDAAAVLRARGPEGAARVEAATRLGSDVPVCLAGGLARMRGRGEQVEPIEADLPDTLRLVVAVPPFGLSTPAVYRAWDDLCGPHSTRAIAAPAALLPWATELVNDLEPAAEAVEPLLRPWRKRLEAVAGRPALLAGSGSAHLVVVDDDDDLGWVARLDDTRGVWVGRPATGDGLAGGPATSRPRGAASGSS